MVCRRLNGLTWQNTRDVFVVTQTDGVDGGMYRVYDWPHTANGLTRADAERMILDHAIETWPVGAGRWPGSPRVVPRLSIETRTLYESREGA